VTRLMSKREETEKLSTLASEPFGALRLVAEGTWVQTFIDEWISRWCTPQRSVFQNWYLRFVASSVQLVLCCRIYRQLQDDQDSRDSIKGEIVRVALHILHMAHDQSHWLHVLNHCMSIPFAALVLAKLSPVKHDIILRCALRFAGDPLRPGANVPTFARYNAEQLIALIW